MKNEKHPVMAFVEDTEFIPKQIGRPDPRKKEKIINAYKHLIEAACSLQLATEYCLREVEGFGIDFFLESLKVGTEKFIRKKFVEINKLNVPGLSTEKLMNSDLLDIEEIEFAISERKVFDAVWETVKGTGFIYPLRALYVNDEIGFDLTEDFHKELQKKICRYTQNNQQNFILDIFEYLCVTLNILEEIDILQAHKGPNELSFLSECIEIDLKNPDGPFVVSDILFWQRRLRQWKEKTDFTIQKKTFTDFVA